MIFWDLYGERRKGGKCLFPHTFSMQIGFFILGIKPQTKPVVGPIWNLDHIFFIFGSKRRAEGKYHLRCTISIQNRFFVPTVILLKCSSRHIEPLVMHCTILVHILFNCYTPVINCYTVKSLLQIDGMLEYSFSRVTGMPGILNINCLKICNCSHLYTQ